MTNRLANCLVKNGLQSGRVAVQADKSVTQLALYAATIKAGGVYLPLNTGYTPHELDYFVSDAKPAIVVVADGISAAITPLAAGIGATLLTLNADETGSLTRQADTASADFVAIARGSEDLGAIFTGDNRGQGVSFAIAICCQTPKCWPKAGISAATTCCCTCCQSIIPMGCSLLAICSAWSVAA